MPASDLQNTALFAADLRDRVVNAPEISTDGWPSYGPAIRDAFGSRCTHGVIVKTYREDAVGMEAARRYSPGDVVAVERYDVISQPMFISTSYVERQNLTLRMQQRRFTRRQSQCRTSNKCIVNYAYAVLESQIRIKVISDGYDPTLGVMHHGREVVEIRFRLDGT